MACALLDAWGCVPERMRSVGDSRDELSQAVAAAMRDHDIAITIGGVSMGKKDLVASVAEGGELVFKGVRVSPGKPFIASYVCGKPVFSLPGKPSGSYAAMELLVKRFVLGATNGHRLSVPLSRDVELQAPGLDYIVFVELREGKAQPLGYEGSSISLFSGPEYSTSQLSTSARTVFSDGYFIARDPVKAGQPVMINLF
jgi:molybdopterin biosynthesis enzyme